MCEMFRSTVAKPSIRGEEFGARYATKIAENIEVYHRLFLLSGRRSLEEVRRIADAYFTYVEAGFPSIAEEIRGIATGAGARLSDVMALNARTELLAICGVGSQTECSVVVTLNSRNGVDAPIGMQAWDWLSELSMGWLLWTIEAPDGHVVHTLTEYGMVGKIGLSSAGTGVLLNILSHDHDGTASIGIPIHVAARSILDERENLNIAVGKITSAQMTASSSLSIISHVDGHATAFSLEIFPGGPAFHLPNERGHLVHTNHFLSLRGEAHDRAPKFGSSSFSRYEQIRRALHSKEIWNADDLLAMFASHAGGSHAICSHPIANANFGERSETLALVQLDLLAGVLRVRRGGACGDGAWATLET